MREKLLHGPLETAASCQVERPATNTGFVNGGGGIQNNVAYVRALFLLFRQNLQNIRTFCVATDVCSAALEAFTSAGSGSFCRMRETHSSWPCKKSHHVGRLHEFPGRKDHSGANEDDSIVLLTPVGPHGNCYYIHLSQLNIKCRKGDEKKKSLVH